MTMVSEHYFDLICKYCIHCRKNKCLQDVPWYAVSLGCNFFEEGRPVVRKPKLATFEGGKPVTRVSVKESGLGFRFEDVLGDRI
jgi:hypothetical protein